MFVVRTVTGEQGNTRKVTEMDLICIAIVATYNAVFPLKSKDNTTHP
jgi:hypothetical protein